MVGIDSDDGSRRRLPSWMLGVSSKDEAIKQRERSENIEKVVKPNTQPKDTKSLVFLKCESKERKRKRKQLKPKDDASDGERINSCSNGNESKIPSPLDDAQDLTVEDLIAIAEEYVRGDNSMRIQQLSSKESELIRESTAPGNQLGDSNILALGSSDRERTFDSALSLTSEQKVPAASGMGDPTQDMLDLFLGPLLKKPVQEKRTEFIKNDMEIDFEFRKSRQDDVGEEIVPLQKKKSSLREKVSLLLD
ncbi:uncharacterized protein LOC110815536 [Carica papaya]|uniref:uncharacterized protein LOC110815536 n=1 Tax=Carica papaya TaxID=3649 RepID=UPI000B8C9B69|nr:uncharacterized protein LOC110815536 [Carica papaya]